MMMRIGIWYIVFLSVLRKIFLPWKDILKVFEADQKASAESSSSRYMIHNTTFELVPSKENIIYCELAVAVCVQKLHRIILDL